MNKEREEYGGDKYTQHRLALMDAERSSKERVITIERRMSGGDGEAVWFAVTGNGEETICLALTEEQAMFLADALLQSLCDWRDREAD